MTNQRQTQLNQPNIDKFAEMLISAARRGGVKGDIFYDSDERCLRFQGRDALYLVNPYREYCSAPRQHRSTVLRHWAMALGDLTKPMPEDFEAVSHKLFPEVRSRAYYHNATLRIELEGGSGADWTYQPIGEHLGAAVVYDMPRNMIRVEEKDLDKWGVTFDMAMGIAMRNLMALPHRFDNPGGQQGVYVTACRDDHDVSRLLISGLLRQLPINGSLVAIAATRSTLLLTGSDDLEGLRTMSAERRAQ